MAYTHAWKGNPPSTPGDARRILLDAAVTCVERLGQTKANLSDVALEAGVTRQTVYRYFENADDLFRSAAVLSSGGFLERLRRCARKEKNTAFRIVECLVFAISELPNDKHLSMLLKVGNATRLDFMLELGFVQEETTRLLDEDTRLPKDKVDELAELLLRMLHSFLTVGNPKRNKDQLRTYLRSWLVPIIDAQCGGLR